MTKEAREKTNLLPGVLRGEAFECKCTVALVTKLTLDSPSVAVWTKIRIASAEKNPPNGQYLLDVHGRVFKIQREDGKWPTLTL
jgi:hypothetical protein